MKLVSFSISNYRSISTAYKLPLTDYTVIVGPNNEGKSNILKGLGLALAILTDQRLFRFDGRLSVYTHYRGLSYYGNHYSNGTPDHLRYNWERDFPINLQKNNKISGRSEFTCEFELTPEEFEEFKTNTKVNLSTNLKARISIGKERDVKIDFLMKGKGKITLNKNKRGISEFINKKLFLQYIPAIRTSELAIGIVNNLLERELSVLENNSEFQDVVKTINKLQQPILTKISKSLKNSVSEFIPDLKGVSIKNQEDISDVINASCRVFIDDGTETELQLKGDGVISLTAISLLQSFSRRKLSEQRFVLLLEEPESHLHPKAIHNLKDVLREISKTNQVIITTHSPIAIERLEADHNIIVQNNKAKPAKDLNEIRESLGIVMSDNLSGAFLVLLVEGEDDKIILGQWLKERSSKISSALSDGSMIIDHLGGATNIGYKVAMYKNNLCNVVAFIDDDDAGNKAIMSAQSKGILKNSEYVLSFCKGRLKSEIEDLIEFSTYSQLIFDDYGVYLDVPSFKNNNVQWSDRVKSIFKNGGKIWNDKTELEVKTKIALKAASLGIASLNKHKTNSVDSLILTLENVLDKRPS